MKKESLGLLGYDAYHFVVEHHERSDRFYRELFDFKVVGKAGDELVARSGQAATVYGAGDVRVVVSTPLGAPEGRASGTPKEHSPAAADKGAPKERLSKAARYLRRHPAGIMSLGFRVADLDHTIRVLESRGGTLIAEPVIETQPGGGTYKSVEVATPLGEVAFRFVERRDYKGFAPGFVDVGEGSASRPVNRYGITSIDHVTSNGLTMQPIVAWYRDVLGFEPFWEISFHTQEVAVGRASGSGLKSIVMWDPESGIKFATNEPLRPFFRDSQIAKFVEDNGGPGVQHIAFAVNDILSSVVDLRKRGVEFLSTPKSYYEDLPARLAQLGITNVKEELALLEAQQVLVDGANDKYMLQIFLREAASLYGDDRAGPFFYELIQRAGDPGFGYGNFRALFESIERAQRRAGQGGHPVAAT